MTDHEALERNRAKVLALVPMHVKAVTEILSPELGGYGVRDIKYAVLTLIADGTLSYDSDGVLRLRTQASPRSDS